MANATLAGVAKMRDNPVGADLIIICAGKQIKAHQHFVCSHSPVITQECSNSDSADGVVSLEIKNFDAETVGHMLDFIYKGDYDYSKEAGHGESITAAELTLHLYVHSIAEKLDVLPLRELAEGRFVNGLKTTSAAHFAEVTQISASNEVASRVLKLAIRDTALDRLDELCRSAEFVNVLGSSTSLNGFATNLLRRTVQDREETVASRLQQSQRQLEQRSAEAKSWEDQAAKHAKTLRMGEKAHESAMDEITRLRSTLNGKTASEEKCAALEQRLKLSQAKEKELSARVSALEIIAQDRDTEIQKMANQDAAVLTLRSTLETKISTIESQRLEVEISKQKAELYDATRLDGGIPAQKAERKRYIIERIKHLSGVLDRCHGCHKYLNGQVMKVSGNDEPVEKELMICCRNCDWRHYATDYLGGG